MSSSEVRLPKSTTNEEQQFEIDINSSNAEINPSQGLPNINDNGEGMSSNSNISDNEKNDINAIIQKRKSYQIRALVCMNI